MSNIKVPITDIAAAVDSQKNVIKAANKELEKFNKKAKDSPLSKSDLDRIKRVEGIRDQAKQSVEIEAQQKASQVKVQQVYSSVQSFTSLSAIQKLTSGQRLDASDVIGFARLIEKPVYNLIERYVQGSTKKSAPTIAIEEKEKQTANTPTKKPGQVWSVKDQLLTSISATNSAKRDLEGQFSIGQTPLGLRGMLNPDGTKAFLPSSAAGFGAVGAAVGAAAYGVNRLINKFDKQDENAESVYQILNKSPQGTVSEDERNALLGNTSGIREFYRDPVEAFKENRASQAKLDSSLGAAGANRTFREALKISRKEYLFDEAIARKKKELGRELTAKDYENVRNEILGSKELSHSLQYYDSANLLAARDRINQKLYDEGRISGWQKLKRDFGTAWERVSFPEGRENVNEYTDLKAEQGEVISPDLKPTVLTTRDIIREQQVSDREAWFGAHRRTRHYYKFNREALEFNRMN